MTRRQGHPGDEDHREGRRARDYTEFGFRELGKADPLDRYLDGEIDRESGAFRAAFVKREFREQLDEMEEILSDLGRPVKGPDLADSILSAVDERRPFMEKRTRRFVTLGRLAAAASVLLAIGVGVMVERARPGVMRLTDEPAPLAAAVTAAGLSRANPPSRVTRSDTGGRGEAVHLRGESALILATLAPLARVKDVEIRWTRDGSAEGWSCPGTGVACGTVTWDRGLWRIPDRTNDGSAGLATFPVLEGEQRAWFAASR